MAVQFVMEPIIGGIPPQRKRHSAFFSRPNDGMETIGERVKKERTRMGLTQQALAAAVGLKKETVRDLELGKSRSTTKLHHLAAALGVSVTWLETGRGERLPQSGTGTDANATHQTGPASQSGRIVPAILSAAKKWVLAEETLAGPYPHSEVVDQVIAVYELMLDNGGVLSAAQRAARFAAAQERQGVAADGDSRTGTDGDRRR